MRRDYFEQLHRDEVRQLEERMVYQALRERTGRLEVAPPTLQVSVGNLLIRLGTAMGGSTHS
ncbi:MAG: hypothetical protein HC876_10720 [Chloroflexaceae bacterium]|nr:hypothetical protein [Chloroflexaceae bacterium]